MGHATVAAFSTQLSALLSGQVIAAHVAAFDVGVLRQSVARYELPGLRNLEAAEDASPDHPLVGRTLCFTGAVFSMVRREVAERITAFFFGGG